MINPLRFSVIYLVCFASTSNQAPGNAGSGGVISYSKISQPTSCPEGDDICAKDQLGYEAIKQLHIAIDDDRDGNLDRSESDEFLRDELEYEDGFDRHSKFHGSDDNISVDDLWKLWAESPVYNWTVDDVVEWLENAVELSQYSETFRINAVEGRILPRIAVNGKYMLNILGIKNAIDKQKLAVKAQDLVLFGPPKMGHNYMKDLLLVFSIVVAAGGCWLAYMQNKYSQDHLKKVMKDLENLQKAEDNLMELQQKLDEAHKEKEDVTEEKKSLELKMEDEILSAKQEAEQLRRTRECTEEEIGRLKLAEQELEKLKRALERAECELKHRHSAPLGELQQWLQLTYEVESKHYDTKREAAEKQLILAKEMYTKIKRKRHHFMGSLQLAHNGHVDHVDKAIIKARSALEEVKLDLQERTQRWHKIEAICGMNIIANPGYDFLDSLLRSPMGSSVSTTNLQNIVSPLNVEDADEDIPPGAFTHSAAFFASKSTSNLLHTMPIRRTPSPRFDRFEPGLRRTQTEPSNLLPNVSSVGTTVPASWPRDTHGVWPNLMRAGMQLTMLGFDLTDHRLRAMHPLPAVAELRERAPHSSVLDAHGGSHDSLHSYASLPPAAALYPSQPRITAFKPVHTPHAVAPVPAAAAAAAGSGQAQGASTSASSEARRKEGDGSGSDESSTENLQAPQNDRVEFGLHELSESSQNQHRPDPRDRSQTYTQSQSVDGKSICSRPRVLATSLSEGSLSTLHGQNGTQQRRVAKAPATPETVDEEMSSLDESYDSQCSDVTGGTKQPSSKKNSKTKTFMKLINKKIKLKNT